MKEIYWFTQEGRIMTGIYLVALLLMCVPGKSNGEADLLTRISKLQFPPSFMNKTGKPVIKIPPFGRLPGIMQYVPKGKQLKEKRLRKRLGKDLDKFWMSIDKPAAQEERVSVSGPNQVRLQILEDIENFTRSYKFQIENTTDIVDETVSFFRQMVNYGSCNVRYEWEDLSILFWPRWVRRGSCDTEASCSFPAGMYCTSSRSHVINLLRWTCKRKRRGSKRRKTKNKTEDVPRRKKGFPGVRCRWKKVPFPVTAECVCSC
uniref:Noggin-2-like isoform X1 n=2 Tax=Crassostrea virginica TaxID=6565 RepID=A0A8B8CDR2_CRAVI|nr:noggin-2-like isoform X1 [Crassostrea virginica]